MGYGKNLSLSHFFVPLSVLGPFAMVMQAQTLKTSLFGQMPSWAEKLSKSAKFHSENDRFGKAFQTWFFWHRWEDPLEAKFYVILSWRPDLFSPAKKARFDSRARFKPPGLFLRYRTLHANPAVAVAVQLFNNTTMAKT